MWSSDRRHFWLILPPDPQIWMKNEANAGAQLLTLPEATGLVSCQSIIKQKKIKNTQITSKPAKTFSRPHNHLGREKRDVGHFYITVNED